MESKINISIITPSLNQSNFITRTLDSVAMQSAECRIEHIVIDGGSTDGTIEILQGRGTTIRFISEPDSGMAEAVNKGFEMANGEIIGWLNSDDIYLPGVLNKIYTYFTLNNSCQWLYGTCMMIDQEDRIIRQWITAYKNRLARKYSYNRLLTDNFISQPAVFFRRQVLEKTGLLDTRLHSAMDYDLWIRLAKLSSPGFIDEDLACFRVHNYSISNRYYKQQFNEQYSIHKKYESSAYPIFVHWLKTRLIIIVYWLIKNLKGTKKT